MMSFHIRSVQAGSRRAAAACLAALLCLPWQVFAADRTLLAIDFATQEGDRVILTLTLSGPAPEPTVFSLDRPARLSLDLPATTLALTERLKKINIGKVRSVAAAEAQGRTRVVVFLTEPVPSNVRTEGNTVIIDLAGAGNQSAAASAAVAEVQRAAAEEAATTGTTSSMSLATAGAALTSVDFRRGERGEGRVIVSLTDPKTVVDVREEGGNVLATFRNTALPERLAKRYDVLDFATPAKYVDVRRAGADVEISITPTGDFEQVAYQTGNIFTLELQPLTREKIDERRRNEQVYTGERISLSFQNVDVRALLQIIADVANVNMVVSDQVQGEMAMRLQNVPWDQALDIILRTKGLGKRQEGNVILVAPLAQMAERDKAELEAQKQNRELAPLRSEIIQVNYARAAELAAIIKSKEASQLSERGSVTVDERTNTLLVLETREKLSEIRELVERLDIPVRQVLIEARIVIANSDFTKDLGARFGVSHINALGDARVGISGSLEGARTTVGGAQPGIDSGLNFSLPVTTGGASRIAFAILGSDYLVDLELSALQSEGRGEVVSSPRVITATGKAAIIEQGEEIPFTAPGGGVAGGQIQFKKATLALEVTPFITPDDRVQMELSVKKDSRGREVPQATGGTAVAIDQRRVDTSVLVDNGDTVVLGGIFEQTNRSTQAKVPLLGDIPLLGRVFRQDNKFNQKVELLIFVTPKILKEGIRIN